MNQKFVEKFDVTNTHIDIENPLTIGNGNFAFTMDITGLQTLAKEYNLIPLLSMENKFASKKVHGSLRHKEFLSREGRKVSYMTDSLGQEKLFDEYRTNHFKYNMFTLAFYFNGEQIKKEEIVHVNQRLSLYYGIVISEFFYKNEKITTKSYVDYKYNTLVLEFESNLFNSGLSVKMSSKEAWYNKEGNNDSIVPIRLEEEKIIITDAYREDKIYYYLDNMVAIKRGQDVEFLGSKKKCQLCLGINDFVKKSSNEWPLFWNKTKDYYNDNFEIQRRVVLSLYLIRVNSLGNYPPAETGLTCNSWYGKFHLEMHLWHDLGMIYYGHSDLVVPSIDYYLTIIEDARKRAQSNGFSGARWPKMTDPSGLDSPSEIGCLLMWQQPHIIFMLDAIKRENLDFSLDKYRNIIYETAECLKSFFILENGKYYLDKPLRPAQEFYEPETVDSPIFEVEYFIYALDIAMKLLREIGVEVDYSSIIENAVLPKVHKGAYEAHLNTMETYTKYNYDHPLPIMAYTFFESPRLDSQIVANSLAKILETFRIDTMWGWDFPSFAMCLYRLGRYEEALKMLLSNYPKNSYLKNGHNIQYPDQEVLPIYLPGNGAFLIACHMFFKK